MTTKSPSRRGTHLGYRSGRCALAQGAIPARQTFGVVTRVARQLGIGTESLRNWLKQAEIDSGRQAGTSSAYAQRIAELERENRELRRANDILKAAWAGRRLGPWPRHSWSPPSTWPPGPDGASISTVSSAIATPERYTSIAYTDRLAETPSNQADCFGSVLSRSAMRGLR